MENRVLAEQMDRLKRRFGEKAFDPESVRLIRKELWGLTESEFTTLVDIMIGTRPHNRPPLVIDFREARLKIQKRDFDTTVKQAATVMNKQAAHESLKKYLAKEFPGCKSLKEAVEVWRHLVAVERADNPNYEPMADQRWMGKFAWVKDQNGKWTDPPLAPLIASGQA